MWIYLVSYVRSMGTLHKFADIVIERESQITSASDVELVRGEIEKRIGGDITISIISLSLLDTPTLAVQYGLLPPLEQDVKFDL